MTVTFDEGKPSLEDMARYGATDLEHYGTKGMKWGVRKKVTGRDIRSARARLGLEQDKLFNKARDVKATGRGQKAYEKQKTAFLNNPDRVLATKLTKGEKAAQVILAGPIGLVTIGAVSAYSRNIAKKQATGAYNKK